MSVKPIPDGYHTVTPSLVVSGAAKVIDFMKVGLGGVERFRHGPPGGPIMHAEIKVGDSVVMLADSNPRFPPMPTALYVYVNDVDSAYKSALKAGGVSLREPTNEFYGDRVAGVKDPGGNQWWLATHVEDLSPEEFERRAQAMMSKKP